MFSNVSLLLVILTSLLKNSRRRGLAQHSPLEFALQSPQNETIDLDHVLIQFRLLAGTDRLLLTVRRSHMPLTKYPLGTNKADEEVSRDNDTDESEYPLYTVPHQNKHSPDQQSYN